MQKLLPQVKGKSLFPTHFPTPMQAVIFRNWDMVAKEKIARVICTSVENVVAEAKRMGLGEQQDTEIWKEKGYITIIKANWHLLPYKQLLMLLGWTEEKLAAILKEEDFLDIKLGNLKPDCEVVKYCPLTEKELEATLLIKDIVSAVKSNVKEEKQPFDFWSDEEVILEHKQPEKNDVIIDGSWMISDNTNDETVGIMTLRFASSIKKLWNVDLMSDGTKQIILSFDAGKSEEYHKISISKSEIAVCAGSSAGILRALYRIEDMLKKAGGAYLKCGIYERIPRFGARYIYPFCALYEAAFDVDSTTYCPDSLLEKYAQTGVNGIWLQAVLYRLTEFPFEPSFSEGWQKRLKNLQDFVKRAKSYGIKIYLYINEPRTLPVSFFEKHPDMKGATMGKYACMCVTSQKTKDYLKSAIGTLCRAVPDLGGFFTITMSENLTHCKSREVDKECPHCAPREPWELAAEVNCLIEEGAHKVNKNIRVIAWDWEWKERLGFKDGDAEKCIRALPQNVALLCKRESEIPFVRGGIAGEVADYSMSVDGISEESYKNWKVAKENGCQTAVKLQINNSWECSTVPYLPVFATLRRQINEVLKLKTDHLMLSWTLGGYPSPNIKLISEAFFIENGNEDIDYENSLRVMYGNAAEKVKAATDIFSEAFEQFPFHLRTIYFGPQNGGVSNPLYNEPTGYNATMTCFCYDDLECWRAIYPEDVFENQYKRLSERWEEGLSLIEGTDGELADISFAGYSLFLSSYHQVRFIKLRNQYLKKKTEKLRKEIVEIIRAEQLLAQKVYMVMQRRPQIGFEAANHYYYSADMVLEKIINCEELLRLYS